VVRSLAHQLLIERTPDACRLDLPRDGAAIRAWLDPMTVWGPRLTSAVAAARPANTLTRGRARAES
jgi:hypothetical protein